MSGSAISIIGILRSALGATMLLGLLAAGLLPGASSASAAGERAGDVTVVDESGNPLAGGGSATPFGLQIPAGAACQGDSADDNYRIEAFMVPDGTDVGSVVYGELAPEGENSWGLWDTNTESYDGGLTAQADPGQPGLIADLPNFSWGVLLPGEMAPGDYRIGIACSLFNDTTRYWDTSYTIVADASDEPAQFRWTTSPTSGPSSGGSSPSTPVLVGLPVLVLIAVAVALLVALAFRPHHVSQGAFVMTIRNPLRRKVARDLARILTIMSAFMLALSGWTAWRAPDSPASAATNAGAVAMAPATGNSGTDFAFDLPNASACSGDSAGGNYRVMSYIVPASVDPATVTFDPAGPLAVAGEYRSALYDTNGATVSGILTGTAATPGGPGIISGIPAMNWAVLLPGEVPAGDYNLGIACIVGQAGPNQLDKFWNTGITITADAAGGPAEFTFAPLAGGTTTTTSGGTTTTADGSTTTTADGSTTTTADGSTTTTAAGGTTTTGGAEVSGSDIFSGGSPAAASPVTTAGQLPYTGSSPVPMIVWAIALLVFGRMAMLLGKRPKVVDGPGA